MSYHQGVMFETDPHRSSTLCIPALPKQPAVDVDMPTKSFEFGSALELYYPLLEFVFEFLEASDLHAAKLVNSTWSQLAKRELRKRISPTWISYCYSPGLRLRVGPGFRYSNVALCIIAYNPCTIRLEKYVCLHDSPDFSRMTFAEYLSKQVVPSGTGFCTIACSKVPSNYSDVDGHNSVYQGIFIPYIPKIRTTMFRCNPKQLDRLSNFINPNEEIRCVLMFSQKYRVKPVETFLTGLLRGQSPKTVALGGGLIRGVKTFSQNSSQRVFRAEDLFCITFLQEEGTDADFNVYSTVVNSDNVVEQQYEEFEAALVKLKQSSVLRTHGLVFRFCCCAKFCKQKETEMIAKHFPKYPLLGLEVDGEIGWDTGSSADDQQDLDAKPKGSPKAKRLKSSMPRILHGWSTVLVLITWGKKIS